MRGWPVNRGNPPTTLSVHLIALGKFLSGAKFIADLPSGRKSVHSVEMRAIDHLASTLRLAISFAVLLLTPGSDASAADKPNIVLILTDDLGINDLSCYGRKDQQTLHLDQ